MLDRRLVRSLRRTHTGHRPTCRYPRPTLSLVPFETPVFELAPPNSASLTSGIAAVSRIPNSMEVWWVGPDGSVQDAYFYETSSPKPWTFFELAKAGMASPTAGVAAVSRIPNSMEIWWVHPDGSVMDAYWYEGSQWQVFDLEPPKSASTTAGIGANDPIWADSRKPRHMLVRWIGPDGSVHGGHWYEGATSWTFREIAPPGTASLTGGVEGVENRAASGSNFYCVGADESIQQLQ